MPCLGVFSGVLVGAVFPFVSVTLLNLGFAEVEIFGCRTPLPRGVFRHLTISEAKDLPGPEGVDLVVSGRRWNDGD